MSIDIEESKNFIRAHARGCYPNECCGLIIKHGNKQEVICGRNVSSKPQHHFMLHPDDYAYADERGEVLAVYHSHCNGAAVTTDADKMLSEKHDLPVIIVGWPKDEWSIYTPQGWKPDLIGRPFVFGVMDCLTLIQDHFREKHSIIIPDFIYEDEFWLHGKDLYRENLPKNGFVEVDRKTIQVDDLILQQLEAPLPNHCAVYLGDGMMLHHPPGHLSGTFPYVCDQGYYALSTVGFYRHEKLFKKGKK